ncbi:hypothetical protein FSW04_02480 [Baekduia soli]|uniref:ABC1 atypical kinase-like domain-containing protein n=1 Tax=Baekduia soli TaxID=496014 RepID=A0A5B8U0K6_9ACTN|nr:AarF/UbiB family protein [Baekduia soli]QEC46553.1 hypothetical protein FSW04_02480 [Baekduia soli]
MPAPADTPPALRGLVDAAAALVRRSSSGRVILARTAAIADAAALPGADPELAARLEQARTEVSAPLRPAEIERTLKAAWGAAPRRVLDALDPEPLAVGPAAQVHRATHEGRDVALKVLRPGLAAAVRSDLALLDLLATPLRQVFGAMDAGAVLRELRETALDELDLEHEASTQRAARRILRPVAGLVVPAPVMDLCGPEVLATELLEGPTLVTTRPADPAAVARTLVAAHVTAARAGLALTDPRPSHVVLLDDGRVGLLGTGVGRTADRSRVDAALQALLHLRAGDQDAFAAVLAGPLGVLPAAEALQAYALTGEVAGELLTGRALLDAAALAEAGRRGGGQVRGGLALAAAARPAPADLGPVRSVAQLTALLARLGAEEDWGALILEAA